MDASLSKIFLSESIMLKLNTSKCKVLSVGRNLDKTYTYDLEQDHQTTSLERVESIQDLGVLERLCFSEHMQDKINEAYAMLGVIKRNFKYLKTSSFILLDKNMVRSHLDYCSSVWSPYRKGEMEDIEKVQKKATKLIPELKRMNYIDRLKKCQLPTLHYRRIRGDMIET